MLTVRASDSRGRTWTLLVPTSRRERARGLLGEEALPSDAAMLFPRARVIHTIGMKGPIKVVFLDGRLRVLEVRRAGPGRLFGPVRGARHVLEGAAGADIRLGDRIQLVTAPSEADPTRRAYFASAPVE